MSESINLRVIGVLRSHLSRVDFAGAFGLLSQSGLNCRELDRIVEPELILVLEIEHSMQLAQQASPEVVEQEEPGQVEVSLSNIGPH